MFDLEQVIRERHSTRLFLPQPVPRALVEKALVLAQNAVELRHPAVARCTSAARPSRRTWCSSTTDPGVNSDRQPRPGSPCFAVFPTRNLPQDGGAIQ